MGYLVQKMAPGCEDFEPFIDTYVDEEFDERERADMEAHLAGCDQCRARVQTQAQFKARFREQLSGERAPQALLERISGELATLEMEGEQSAAVRRPLYVRLGWVAGPLAAMLALVILLPEMTIAPAASSQAPVVDQTVEWHKGNFPLEITTSDPQEASAWFENKVDFSVRLPHFDNHRVNLLGGRIAHIEDRRAALVLYEVDGARLSVLLFDGEGLRVPRESIRNVEDRDIVWLNQKGFGVAVVQDHGVTYAMTSDLNEDRFLGLVAGTMKR
ncbi:hypothetical protein DL240_08655 [Lujinxingia litoralis]|uniref:Putative zinc-finger domain-containing protein n=1 Tax=Lujinxingia litoralis TaxID=2211119 RepID=A0A328C5T7_9DELT|nr:zf-HC2 domain-containing protein [Lujinxingia litoralis]RAL22951.1 hypothetical protein DL240_08655 [Lujinxingia litoralis]